MGGVAIVVNYLEVRDMLHQCGARDHVVPYGAVLGVWGEHRYWGTGGGGGGLWVDAAKRDEQEQRTDFCRLLIVFVFSVVDRT